MLTLLGIFCAIVLALGYKFYSPIVEKWVGADKNRLTPAFTKRDNIDFSPTDRFTLFGHHFSAIAGSGPIIGPVLAALAFGWGPAVLWIVVGAIFVGSVHDYTVTMASLRHGGNSIGAICKNYMAPATYKMFLIFVWATLCYVILVFTDLTVASFAPVVNRIASTEDIQSKNGGVAATSTIFIMGYSMIYGYIKNKGLIKPAILIPFSVFLVFFSIYIGNLWPLNQNILPPFFFDMEPRYWIYAGIVLYCLVASVLPVSWLLQPRDFLTSFLLYACLLGGLFGLVFAVGGDAKEINYAFFKGWNNPEYGFIFPALFVTIACGAVSGFHSTVASGTTSKQLSNEKDARPVAFLSMIIEGVLAILAVSSVIIISGGEKGMSPVAVFSTGFGKMVSALGFSSEFAGEFALISLSCFLMTTLDACTRLARYTLQELLGFEKSKFRVATTIACLIIPSILLFTKIHDAAGNIVPAWKAIWPLFGAMNQLLAAISMLVVFLWLKSLGKRALYVAIPMVFVSISALTELVTRSFKELVLNPHPNYLIGVTGSILAVFAILIALDGIRNIFFPRYNGDSKDEEPVIEVKD